MSKPLIRIHNIETDEIIDREMTDAEFAEFEAKLAKEQAEAQAKADEQAAKSALLEKLGITEEEARLLLS
jgi:hypothetical protein